MGQITLGPFNIPANQWAFTSTRTLPVTAPAGLILQATDPNNQWFTTTGNVKTWGVQVQGYVGAPWDNISPWSGWGWWLYEPGGDPTANVNDSSVWIPFGRQAKNGGVGLILGLTTSMPAGTVYRFGIQTDAAIRLGLSVTETT